MFITSFLPMCAQHLVTGYAADSTLFSSSFPMRFRPLPKQDLTSRSCFYHTTTARGRKGRRRKNHPAGRRGGFVSGDQIFVTILMPGPMVDAVTQDLMYWPFEAAGLALMIAPMSAL